jgi:glutathione S-transferase
MVTAETSNEILFTLEDCTLSKFIEISTKFLPLPPKILRFKASDKKILSYTQTKNLPCLKSGDDFISGTIPIAKYLILSSKDVSDGVILDNRIILLGKNLKEEAKIDMWLNFIFSKIFPITIDIERQLYGKKRFDIRKFEFAINDLLEILIELDKYLQFNTFLTANHIQLGDIMLASALFNCFNDVFTINELELIPNVTRVFKFVSHMRLFRDVFGNYKLCKKIKKAEPFVEIKRAEK